MQQITTVTQKGQITIPKKLRDEFAIGKYSKVILEKSKNFIKITPAKDILDLAGSFIPKKVKSVLEAREAMEKKYKRI